jgi:hypothetical protein
MCHFVALFYVAEDEKTFSYDRIFACTMNTSMLKKNVIEIIKCNSENRLSFYRPVAGATLGISLNHL